MIELILLRNFLIALALGALIGLEREYARHKKRGHAYAGIRTFPLIALFGALAAYFGDTISVWILIVSIILMGAIIVLAYFAATEKSRQHIGATSEVAGFITFFIGALCYHNELIFAALLAIVMAVILYSRSMLHHFAEKIKKKELGDTLKFAVIAFVVLPFLPNKGYGPLEIFNPFIIWLMVVFISGISFVGYILMKWLGEKGITLAGILGGLASSTAVMMSFAERSKKQRKISPALILGVILANGIMFIRILVEVFVLNQSLFMKVLLPILVLASLTAIFSYFLWRKAKKTKGKIQLGSPFTLKPALKFGVLFAIVLALVKVADFYLSSKGVYLVSFLSGFADVDAITVSLSQLANTSLLEETAQKGIIIATLTNIATKGGIAYWFGGKQFGRIIMAFFAALIFVGVGMVLLL